MTKKPWKFSLVVSALLMHFGASGCSSDDPAPTPSVSAAGTSGAGGVTNGVATPGGSGGSGGSGTTTTVKFNGCSDSDYVDLSAASADRTIKFAGVSYTPACILIAAGQKVSFSGSFGTHPLRRGIGNPLPADPNGGSPNNPIPPTDSGTTPIEVTFPAAGNYPYYCEVHKPSMVGVVRVKLRALRRSPERLHYTRRLMSLLVTERGPNPRRLLIQTIFGMGVVLTVVALGGHYFRPQLQAVGFRFLHHFGAAGLAFGPFLADGFHCPVPPQFYLLTAITTGYPMAQALGLVFAGSLMGACTSILLGVYASRFGFLRDFLRRSEHRVQGLFARYGAWAVVVGSFTPAPFSLLCNLAGFYRVPFRMRALLVVLRVPRLYLYYWLMRAGWS